MKKAFYRYPKAGISEVVLHHNKVLKSRGILTRRIKFKLKE